MTADDGASVLGWALEGAVGWVCAMARPEAMIATAAAVPINLIRMTISMIELSLPLSG
jgi:hypothetical protein